MHERTPTTDAVEIMHRLFIEGNPEAQERLRAERIKFEVAQHIHDLRASGAQTQKEFGKIVGVAPTIIDNLEEADYEGDLLAMLAHIEKAYWEHFPPFNTAAKGVYADVLRGTTITGLKLRLFRYHPNRKTPLVGGSQKEHRSMLMFDVKAQTSRQHILCEFAAWHAGFERNRRELEMFALAGMTEWCHLDGGLRGNFTGDPNTYIHALDIHTQLINAAIHYLETGEPIALKQWRQDMGTQEEARYIAELENALHEKTFEEYPDAEWLVQTLIGFVGTDAGGN